MKYSVALFIGRFQPFHKGHLYSLKKCFEIAENVIVGIGSSQEGGSISNPWDYETRKKMLQSTPFKLKIVAIPDLYDDKKWGEQIARLVRDAGYDPEQVVAVGNNDWTNRIMKNEGIAVYQSGLYMRDKLEGEKIREMMGREDEACLTAGQSWKERVPKSVVKCIEEYDNANKN